MSDQEILMLQMQDKSNRDKEAARKRDLVEIGGNGLHDAVYLDAARMLLAFGGVDSDAIRDPQKLREVLDEHLGNMPWDVAIRPMHFNAEACIFRSKLMALTHLILEWAEAAKIRRADTSRPSEP